MTGVTKIDQKSRLPGLAQSHMRVEELQLSMIAPNKQKNQPDHKSGWSESLVYKLNTLFTF